jgi:hypothetical protein
MKEVIGGCVPVVRGTLVAVMKRRRLTLVAASFCLVAMVVWWLWPTPGITRSNCDRLRQGVTEQQVDAIFGRSRDGSGISSAVLTVFPYLAQEIPRWQEGTKVNVWFADTGIACILFDRNGQVVGKSWRDSPSVANRNSLTRFWDRIKEWWSPPSTTTPMTMPAPPASAAPSCP